MKRSSTKSVRRLPDLEDAKCAVLNSLTSPDVQRGYRHAIDDFVDGCCSEPRVAFHRMVVLRYGSHLEISPNTRLARSIYVVARSAASLTKQPTADCSELIWQSASAE